MKYTGYSDLLSEMDKALKKTRECYNKCLSQLNRLLSQNNSIIADGKLNPTITIEQTQKKANNQQQRLKKVEQQRTNRVDSSLWGRAALTYFGKIVKESAIKIFSEEYGERYNIDTIMSCISYNIDDHYQPIFNYNGSMLQKSISPNIELNKKAFNINYASDNFRKSQFESLEAMEMADFYGLEDDENPFLAGDYNLDPFENDQQQAYAQYGGEKRVLKTPAKLMDEVKTLALQEYNIYFITTIQPKMNEKVSQWFK